MTKIDADEFRRRILAGEALPDGLTVYDWLDLSGCTSLTHLPDGLTVEGWLYLGGCTSLTHLPDDLTVEGSLYLGGCTEEWTVGGKKVRLRMIDGICTRLIASRQLGEVTLWSAQYFRGKIDDKKRCFVAIEGNYSAHGETAEQAMRDLRFKIAQVDFDASALAATIRQRGTVTFNDYRLITGACASGLAHGLQERGMDASTDELPLEQVLELCRDGYGGEQFRRVIMGEKA